MGLFLDLEAVDEARTNDALEYLCKAHHDHDDGIWDAMPTPLLVRLVDLFTQRGLNRLDGFRTELQTWVEGHRHTAGERIERPAGLMERWNDAERALVKLYLEHLPPAEWTLDDYSLCVDYLANRYFPVDDMRTEAEWLATRSSLMGRVQEQMGEISAKQADKLLMAMPSTVSAAVAQFGATKAQKATMEFAATRCAENVRHISETVRHSMRNLIAEHVTEQVLGAKGPGSPLETKLLDRFAVLNRDWRRIAVTESSEALNQGYIASIPIGSKVKRIEQYRNACAFCRKIDGVVVEVVSPEAKDKNWDKQIWTGKTNIGRSASPRKRVGRSFVERDPNEMWVIPAGVVHPHCFISPRVPIYTVDGWKQISKIKVGDLVLTHTGKFKAVNWVLDGARHTGDVIRFVVSSNGKNAARIAEMTPEHPILTERGWVAAGDIRVGEKISALAKTCPTCGDAFVNVKHPHVTHCGNNCVPHSGENQFSTNDPEALEAAIRVTAEANRKRMRSMTIEQRRDLTKKARESAMEKGFYWLKDRDAELLRVAGVNASKHNYTPSPVELDILEMLDVLGFDAQPQFRVDSNIPDSLGRKRFWWIDIALPEQKIAVEIDGYPWHGKLGDPGRDLRRDNDLQSSGWTVMRFDSVAKKQDPYKVVETIARLAMNHSDEYRFSFVTVDSISRRHVNNAKLYNFGVDEDESYVIGRGIVVHNCRGRWVQVSEPHPGDDADFAAWLDATLNTPKKD